MAYKHKPGEYKSLLAQDIAYRDEAYQKLLELLKSDTYRNDEAICRHIEIFDGSCDLDYSDALFQHWYVCHYHLGYVYEYALMYQDVLGDLEQKAPKKLSVLTIGAGTCPDYRGAMYARWAAKWPVSVRLSLDYVGVDLAPWDSNLVVKSEKYDSFEAKTATNIVDYLKSDEGVAKLKDVDIVVFAKSLGDLPESVVQEVVDALVQYGPDSFYLCNVPPCNHFTKEEMDDNRAVWLNRGDIEYKLNLIQGTLRSGYELDVHTPAFTGLAQSLEDFNSDKDFFNSLWWTYRQRFSCKDVQKEDLCFKDITNLQDVCSRSCTCGECSYGRHEGYADRRISPLNMPAVTGAGRVAYEVYRCARKEA